MVYSTRRFVVCLSMCRFVLVFFSPFSIAITSLGEERANLSAFRTFFSVCACLDLSVSSSSWSLGRAAVCDCGTPWTFLLPFFLIQDITGLKADVLNFKQKHVAIEIARSTEVQSMKSTILSLNKR